MTTPHKWHLIFLFFLTVGLTLIYRAKDPELAFRDKIQEGGNGWLTRHFGTHFPEVDQAQNNLIANLHSTRDKKAKLEQTLQELSDANARQLIQDKIRILTQQEEKLDEITERLEEITYTYILLKSAQHLLPAQADEEDMKVLISEVNAELRQTEEIEQELNATTIE